MINSNKSNNHVNDLYGERKKLLTGLRIIILINLIFMVMVGMNSVLEVRDISKIF